jgi:anti-anti-sigma regulatory factor
MGVSKRRNNKMAEMRSVVDLGESLDIAAVGALRERLLDVLANNDPVTLDATSIQQVDTAGLQVLCSFARSAAEQGVSVTWAGQTELIGERARLLGLGVLLGMPADTEIGA